MLVIVCGGDGVGKTTLCENILKHGNWRTQHFSQPKDMADGKRQYFEFLDTIKPGEDVLCDRFHDGEWVYAPIYRGYTGDYLAEIEEKINGLPDPVLLLYVTADEKDVMHRIGVRGEDFVKNDDHVKVHMNYHKFMAQQTLPFAVINTSQLDPKQAYAAAQEYIDTAHKVFAAAKQPTCPCSLSGGRRSVPRGNIDAQFMVVGQNPGHARNHAGMFTRMWTYTPSSPVLIDALTEAGIYLDTWITNAVLCETEDNVVAWQQISACSERLKAEAEHVNPQVVITLGLRAQEACVRAGFDAKYTLINVEHPTHAKRFNNIDAFKASVKKIVDDHGMVRPVLGKWGDGK